MDKRKEKTTREQNEGVDADRRFQAASSSEQTVDVTIDHLTTDVELYVFDFVEYMEVAMVSQNFNEVQKENEVQKDRINKEKKTQRFMRHGNWIGLRYHQNPTRTVGTTL